MKKNMDNFMSRKPSGVVFDLDGTLVDSARDLSAALNYVLKKARCPEIHIAQVRNMVGDGARALIIKGFSESGIMPDKVEIDAIQTDFLDYYYQNITDQTIIFPGAMRVIEKLVEMEVPLGLCTNKAIRLTEKLMTEIGLSDYFTAIVGGDSFDYQKPDPRHVISTLEMMGVSPQMAVMVGDSANDIIAARNAGISSVAVSFGYSKIPVADLNADIVIDHYDDFFDALMTF
ncbi:Phosphoglycolate phosphatase [hydrothermal vent metagenome]|uniref:phosphoglycolate phosphatase n=1 Tax=hydrothermal vent metagenome TaxID=652676 RepID=A0A3B0T183_9ZZZZ